MQHSYNRPSMRNVQADQAAQRRLQSTERQVQQLQQEVQDSQAEAARQHTAQQVAAAEQQQAAEAAAEQQAAAQQQVARLEKRVGCYQRRLDRRTQQLATALAAAAAADGASQQPGRASDLQHKGSLPAQVLSLDPAGADLSLR